MENQKSWYQSKTLWANLVAVVSGSMLAVFGIDVNAPTAVAVLGIVNILLRFATDKKLIS